MKPVIIGTAGHIDHGKTALVRALTGTNTDRLKEEQNRGITIELGYAFLNDQIAIIDVPGHERFIKNMVAGAATVDCACLVVAADDGIMPQTREHFDILKLLGIESGIVVITKCSLAEEDWIDLVEEDIREMVTDSFLDGAPILRADSLSKDGIETVRAALIHTANQKKDRPAGAIFRLPIDRVFSIKGFGTVITGSALSGSINVEDKLELLPSGQTVRVRGVEHHGEQVKTGSAGMRLAINLPGIGTDDVSRGDVLVTPGRLNPTFMLDAECRILLNSPVPLVQRQRVRVHLGTKEVMGRVVILDKDQVEPGEESLIQLRLEERTSAQRLDRYVIRRYSPPNTIGGGRVLDANPTKHRKRHTENVVGSLKELGEAKDEQLILKIVNSAKIITFDDLVAKSNLDVSHVEDLLGILGIEGQLIELEAKGKRYLAAQDAYLAFTTSLVEKLKAYHQKNPLRVGTKKGEILSNWKKEYPDFLIKHFVELAIGSLQIKSPSGDLLALYDFEVQFTKKQRNAIAQLETALQNGGFQPPDVSDLAADFQLPEKDLRTLLQTMVDRDQIINLEGKIYFHKSVVVQGIDRLRELFKAQSEITLSDFRTKLQTSRKYALPLANYYDNLGYTKRNGEVRIHCPKLYDNASKEN